MVSLWILNKKISGSIVSASRHAIREALFSILPLSDPAHHHWASQRKQHLQKQRDQKYQAGHFLGTPSTAPHPQEKKKPLLPQQLAWSGYGVMVWEDWMNVAICVGNIEMLDNSPSGFTEPNHPCGQHAAAPVNLILIISTQSSWFGHTQLVSLLNAFFWCKAKCWHCI